MNLEFIHLVSGIVANVSILAAMSVFIYICFIRK